jgi:hypothetical protein
MAPPASGIMTARRSSSDCWKQLHQRASRARSLGLSGSRSGSHETDLDSFAAEDHAIARAMNHEVKGVVPRARFPVGRRAEDCVGPSRPASRAAASRICSGRADERARHLRFLRRQSAGRGARRGAAAGRKPGCDRALRYHPLSWTAGSTPFDGLVTRGSIFDLGYSRALGKAAFLRTLGQRLSRPVMPNVIFPAVQLVKTYLPFGRQKTR